MIQKLVTEIGGIASYGYLSMCLFFAVFAGALWWAFRLKKPFLTAMSSLPLDEQDADHTTKGEDRNGQ
jgi:hypothetical protein